MGQKNRTVFRLDNFVTVIPKQAGSMSTFWTFYRVIGTKHAWQ